MRSVPVSVLTAISLCFGHGAAHALGFGRTSTPSVLGAPLDFEATVHLAPDETLRKECIAADVFAGEIRVPAEQVRVFLQGSGPGDRTVRVMTGAAQ